MDIEIREHPSLYTSTYEEGREEALRAVSAKSYPRPELIDILHAYNTSIGNDERARQNIAQLTQKNCVVTGQQLGLMGGPAYTVLKGISCLLLAKELNAVPIFWFATEDHDVHEIDHTYLLDEEGNLKEFKLHFGERRLAVEDLKLTAHHREILNVFARETGLNFPLQGESYAHTMASFMAYLFRGTGLVFLEPRLLRALSREFFRKELREYEKFVPLLNQAKTELHSKGSSAPLLVSEGPQLFFKSDTGQREKLLAKEGSFYAGPRCFTLSELEKIVDERPERFSTNALARPVLQSALLPTVAYVAGPTEFSYYQQLKAYHAAHGSFMPWIVPRLSGTLITPKGAQFLNKLNLHAWEPIPTHWAELMPELERDLQNVREDWERTLLRLFSEELSKKTIERHMRALIDKLRKNITSKRLHNQEIPSFALHYLRNLLHPHQQLQERVLNWNTFQAKTESNLIQECLQRLQWNTRGHLYLFVN